MEPKHWGKFIWTSIHIIALGYPDKPTQLDKQNYKEFLTNFWKVIPCYKCSQNYQVHLKELPIDEYLTDNLTLFEWTVKLHNIVNKQLGKNEWTLEEARAKFSRIAKGQDETFVSVDSGWDKIIRYSTSGLVVGLAITILYFFVRKTSRK